MTMSESNFYSTTDHRNSTNSSSVYYEDDIVVDADRATTDADNNDDRNNDGSGTSRQVIGAAVLGGIAGLVVVGPLVGIVAAGGAAALATSRGKAGDVARKSGDVVSDAGTRLKKFDEKHHVVAKTSKGVSKGYTWISKKLNPPPSTPAASVRRTQSTPTSMS